jgi:hypothetical protein
MMQRAIAAMAFVASLISLVVIAGGGSALLAIENSGERATGGLLAFAGLAAFVAVTALVFARKGSFATGARRALAIAAALLGVLPVAALAFVLIRFAGFPLGSATPLLDWSALALGAALGLGALGILALGHRRSVEGRAAQPEPPVVVHMQQIRHAQQQLRSVFEADALRRALDDSDDDEVRVRRV